MLLRTGDQHRAKSRVMIGPPQSNTLAGIHNNARRKDICQMRGRTPLHQAKRQGSGPRLPLSDVEQLARGAFRPFGRCVCRRNRARFRSRHRDRKCRGRRGERARMLQISRNKPICETEGSRALCASRIQGSRKRVQDRLLKETYSSLILRWTKSHKNP